MTLNQNKYFVLIKMLVFSFSLMIIGISISSCGDKCKDVLCENGYCIKGDCFCDTGYSGERCEIKESDKYVGLYAGKLSFPDIPGSQVIDMKVKNYDFNPFDLKLNINNHNGVEFFNLNAHVNKDSILIEQSFNEHITPYDTIINLIYPSKGILKQDSILEFPIVYRNIDSEMTYTVNLKAVKQR